MNVAFTVDTTKANDPLNVAALQALVPKNSGESATAWVSRAAETILRREVKKKRDSLAVDAAMAANAAVTETNIL